MQLLDENTALRLLLEEAHTFGSHSWACAKFLSISPNCDCWYGDTSDALIAPIQLTHPIGTIQCKCGHLSSDHTGRLVGEPKAACIMCMCPCMGFTPKAALDTKPESGV